MFQQGVKKPREKSDRCKITVKKKADGTSVREISGNCSNLQLKALSEIKEE